MNKEELLKRITEECNSGDCEADHSKADKLLLAYIDDDEITKVFENLRQWYA